MKTFFLQAKAGQANTVDVLKVMEAFSNETNYTVWTELATNLGTLSKLLTNTDFGQLFKEFVKTLFTDIYQKLGWTPKDDEGKHNSTYTPTLKALDTPGNYLK